MSANPADHDQTLARIKRLALGLLARRDHTCFELKQKLARKGFVAADIESVVARLETAGLINVDRFVQNYRHYRQSKGYGPRRIAMELQAKGVTEALIAEHLEITDNAWFAEIRTVWRKQFKGKLPENAKERGRQMRFLLNRGFTTEQIRVVLKDAHDEVE